MIDHLVIEPMTDSFVVWRCLHGGPLDAANIGYPMPNPQVDWSRIESRNVLLLKKLIATYGSCAIVARDSDSIVATLRFYPKALCTFSGNGLGFCLQQEFPAGPSDQLVLFDLPPVEKLGDRTLFIHCLMIVAPKEEPNRYRRKGLATRMARELIRWGIKNKWNAIEVNAYEEIPTLYAIAGVAGRRFWQKLDFCVIKQDTEPGISGDILESVRKDAVAVGIPIGDITNRYRMRLEIAT